LITAHDPHTAPWLQNLDAEEFVVVGTDGRWLSTPRTWSAWGKAQERLSEALRDAMNTEQFGPGSYIRPAP
jgi:hypothetical protein